MSGLRHRAVLYEGPDEFLAVALPFVQDAVNAGEPIIAVAHTPNVDALREALGPDGDYVELHDSHEWYLSPGHSFRGFLGFAAANADASCVRMLGEPVWPVGWDALVAEYAHYESVFNVIAKDAPIVALCPYDVSALPDEILDHARATHPEVYDAATLQASPAFVEPEVYCAHLIDRPQAPKARARHLSITPDLSDLREVVLEEALAAGVHPRRLSEFMLAVHELAANALVHADGPADLRTWCEERTFVCEVESRGSTLSETTAGYVPLDLEQERGRGLWLVRQVCELVEVRSRAGRTSIRVHVRRGSY